MCFILGREAISPFRFSSGTMATKKVQNHFWRLFLYWEGSWTSRALSALKLCLFHPHSHWGRGIRLLLCPALLTWCFYNCPAVVPMLGEEEEAHRPYPLGKTVTSLALWPMSWVTWLGSGMNTPGQTETSMSPSSEKTSSQVRSLCGVWKLKARWAAPTRQVGVMEQGCREPTSAHL